MKKINYIGAVLLGSLALSLSPVCASAYLAANTEAVGTAVDSKGPGLATVVGPAEGTQCVSQCGTASAVEKRVDGNVDSGWAAAHQRNISNGQQDSANESVVDTTEVISRLTSFNDLTVRIIKGWIDTAAINDDGIHAYVETKMVLTVAQVATLREIAGVECGVGVVVCSGVDKWNKFAIGIVTSEGSGDALFNALFDAKVTRWGPVDIATSVYRNTELMDYLVAASDIPIWMMIKNGTLMPLATFFNNVIVSGGNLFADGCTTTAGRTLPGPNCGG